MRRQSISTKLILLTLVVWVVVAVPGALWEVASTWSRQRETQESYRRQVNGRLGAVLSEMLWNMDIAAMRSFLQTELTPLDVVAVSAYDATGDQTLFTLVRTADGRAEDGMMPAGPGLERTDIPIRHSRGGKEEVIGRVSVWFDPGPAQRELTRILLIGIGGSLTLLTAVCAVLVMALERNLVRPIDIVRRRMQGTATATGTAVDHTLPATAFAELRDMSADLDRMLADLESAAAALRERERLYRTLFNSGVDAVIVLEDGHIREANLRAEQLFAVQSGGLVGRTLPAMAPLHQPDEQPSEVVFARQLSDPDGTLFPWRAVRFDGIFIDLEIALGRADMGGRMVVLASLRDVTERNSLDAQLRQVQKMETIGQLAGGVAHDFNNVLTAVIGSAEMIARESAGSPVARQHAEHILTASQRAATLVRQLLAFSRRRGVSSTPLDMHRIISDTAALLQRTLVDQRVSIALRLEASLVTVAGDSAMLQNALLNLGVNARDAMPAGGTITISTRIRTISAEAGRAYSPVLIEGEYLEVAVADTGTGMTDEVKKRCFEAFFTTKEVGKGTGLGLAAVSKAALDHRGAVELESALGQGTTFRLLLPVSAQDRPSSAEHPSLRPVVPGVGRILVVDDDDLIRFVSCQQLIGLGYTVVQASDGAKGVDAWFNDGPFDLMIVDMEMPTMRGVDCLQAIRARDPSVKALLCSGFSRDGDSKRLREEGFLGFLNKPYLIAELSTTVAAAIQGKDCFAEDKDVPQA